MQRTMMTVLLGALILAGGGCVNISLPETVSASLLPPDTSFVISGQAQARAEGQACPVWLADDGQPFVLFQNPGMPNELFDAITTPGARSRLHLVVRSDLIPLCQPDVLVVQVTQVLEINGQKPGL